MWLQGPLGLCLVCKMFSSPQIEDQLQLGNYNENTRFQTKDVENPSLISLWKCPDAALMRNDRNSQSTGKCYYWYKKKEIELVSWKIMEKEESEKMQSPQVPSMVGEKDAWVCKILRAPHRWRGQWEDVMSLCPPMGGGGTVREHKIPRSPYACTPNSSLFSPK